MRRRLWRDYVASPDVLFQARLIPKDFLTNRTKYSRATSMGSLLVGSVISFVVKLDIATSAPVRFGAIRVGKHSVNLFLMPVHAIPALKLLLAHGTLKQLPRVQSHVLRKTGRRFKHFIANFANKLILRIMASHMFVHVARRFKSFVALSADKVPPVGVDVHGHLVLGDVGLGGGAVVAEAALVWPVPEPVDVHVIVHVPPGGEGFAAGPVKARVLTLFISVPSDVVLVNVERLFREI